MFVYMFSHPKTITTAEPHVTRPHLKEEGLQIDDTHEPGLRRLQTSMLSRLCAFFSKPVDALHGAASISCCSRTGAVGQD
jgi:hypothetical protein